MLTGATGFIGRNLYPELVDAGYDVLCASRQPDEARKQYPDRSWVEFDVHDPELVESALKDCDRVYYLIHEMAAGAGYAEREKDAARTMRDLACEAGVNRLVYLGGIEPDGQPSAHLSSRLETGRILRQGTYPAVELRCSMIIGGGSTSWQIVRDLAARLPAMLLPSWTTSRTEPVFLEDVVKGLVGALEVAVDGDDHYDMPGPEVLSVREIIERTAAVMNRSPLMIPVPFLSPRLSSRWLRFVTRADTNVARELVEGLKNDILSHEDGRYWDLIGHTDLVGFDDATRGSIEVLKQLESS